MATDAWAGARGAVVAVWRSFRPEQIGEVERELDATRAEIVAARDAEDIDTEEALTGSWRLRLHQLVRDDPDAVDELRRVLEEELTPLLRPEEQAKVASVVIKGRASGSARLYQAGRDIHLDRP